MIDLDNFKDVNDSFGHKAGDDLLKGVAGALRHRVRQTDVLARMGGDEFAVLLPQADAEQAQIVADGDGQGPAAARGGARRADRSASRPASASRCSTASSDARGAGLRRPRDVRGQGGGPGPRSRLHAPAGTTRRRTARLDEAERIRRALDERTASSSTASRSSTSSTGDDRQYELLLRLRDDGAASSLPPGAFLYVAERFGLIQAIDRWVVRQAIALIAEHAARRRRSCCSTSTSRASRSAIPGPRGASTEQLLAEPGSTRAPGLRADGDGGDRQHRGGAAVRPAPAQPAAAASRWTTSARASAPSTTSRTCRSTTSRSTATSSAACRDSPMDQLVVAGHRQDRAGHGQEDHRRVRQRPEHVRPAREEGVDYAQGYHVGRPQPAHEVFSHVGVGARGRERGRVAIASGRARERLDDQPRAGSCSRRCA